MSERHTIAALAHPRSMWPTSIARWATSGAVPVDLLTCLSSNELTAVLASGANLSAVLLDGANSRVDEHVITAIRQCGAVPIGVHAADVPTDWDRLGVSSTLAADFSRENLVALLDAACGGDRAPRGDARSITLPTAETHATVIAVCGSRGCGASVVSMALAQGFAEGPTNSRVLLVDGARRSHHAMYHHTGDVIPGLIDLLGHLRRATIDASELHELTFGTNRGYRLLLGAPTMREGAAAGTGVTTEALLTAARHNDLVVVDHDGEVSIGPITRSLSTVATIWVIVAAPGIKGLHDAVRLTEEACSAGIPAKQVLVVCNRVRRRDPARVTFPVEFSRITRAMGLDVAPVTVLPEFRIESAHRDAAPLPPRMSRPVANRARRMIERADAPRGLSGSRLLTTGAP